MEESCQSQCDALARQLAEITGQIQARKDQMSAFSGRLRTRAKAKASDDEMERLVKQKSYLIEKLQEVKTSPFLKLPYDVLYEIFLSCLAHQPPLSQNCTLLVLTHISQQTRRIGLESARLWSSIAIELSASNIDICTAKVEEWLRRSGELSLSLFVTESPSSVPVGEITAELFEIIHDESYRWENVTFSACLATMKRLLPGRRVQIPRLRSVDIHVQPRTKCYLTAYQKLYNNSSFANNPGIERLRLSLPQGYDNDFHIHRPSLTYLILQPERDYSDLNLRAATNFLNQASQLRKLDITISDISHAGGSVVLPLLNDLTLRTRYLRFLREESGEQTMYDWLAAMDLPSLKRLALSEHYFDRIYLRGDPLFSHLLQNVGDRLVYLSLIHINSPAVVIDYLRLCPNLETLYIEDLHDYHFKDVNDVGRAWYDYLTSYVSWKRRIGWCEALLHCFVGCPNRRDLMEICPRLETFSYVVSEGEQCMHKRFSISQEREKMAEMGTLTLGV